MSIPSWLLDVFAAVMLLVAGASAVQLAAGYPSRWARMDADITVSHLVMSIAMAGMLVTSLRTLPAVAWEVIFAILTVWFAWSAWRQARGAGLRGLAGGHYAPHLVHSAAMLYMYLALARPAGGDDSGMSGMGGPGGSGGMGTLRLPVIAFVFILLLVGYTARDLDRWAGSDGYFHVLRAVPAGPGLTTAGPALVTRTPGGRAAADGSVTTVAQPEAVRDTASGTPAPVRAPVGAPEGTVRLIFAPGVVKACRVAMGVTMAFMLVILI